MIENSILKRLPDHLRQYIKPQNYDHYTAIDQAIWRYAMRKNVHFLSQHAHQSYRKGLTIAGIDLDRIPNLYGMNRILKDIGWAAVAVDGFIPPRAFMEFQAYNVLVIAMEMRQLQHIEYTPSPDIIHESAGHAPLLAIPEYAAFLKRFGEIGAKAIGSPYNKKMFNAIRKLSLLKEQKDSSSAAIETAEEAVRKLQNQKVSPSEMDQLRNLHWWSVEYGLIGTPKNFKLYGAGLLSSIGESEWCLSNKVKKKYFDATVIHQKFDITQPQPQLFVTPNFAHLSKVLEEVAHTMGLRKGGKLGMERLIASEEVGTIELSTGLQISGEFSEMIPHPKEPSKVAYVQTQGATALAFQNEELIGHSIEQHADGFGSPIGKLKGSNMAIEDMTPGDLEAFGLIEGATIKLVFDSEVSVKGKIITGVRNRYGKIMLISFHECTVRFKDSILFQPQWGRYDMAIGKNISAAYAGPADSQHYPFTQRKIMPAPVPSPPKINSRYRAVEEFGNSKEDDATAIESLGKEVLSSSAEHWLLVLNFYDYCLKKKLPFWQKKALKYLKQLKNDSPSISHLIDDGLKLSNT